MEKIQVQGIDLHVAISKQTLGEAGQSGNDNPMNFGEEPSLRQQMKQQLDMKAESIWVS